MRNKIDYTNIDYTKINGPFTKTPNSLIWEKKLTIQAKEIYTLIQSFPPEIKIKKKRLLESIRESTTFLNSCIKELKDNGYLEIKKSIAEHGHYDYEYVLNSKDDLDSSCFEISEDSSSNKNGEVLVEHCEGFIDKTNCWTGLPKEMTRDKLMSTKCKGLYNLLRSCPPGWKFSRIGIAGCIKESFKTIDSCIRELKQHGYLEIKKYQDSNGSWCFKYIINFHPRPASKELLESLYQPTLEDQSDPKLIANVDSFSHNTNSAVSPEVDLPYMVAGEHGLRCSGAGETVTGYEYIKLIDIKINNDNSKKVEPKEELSKEVEESYKAKTKKMNSQTFKTNQYYTNYLINKGYLDKNKDKEIYPKFNNLFIKLQKEYNCDVLEIKDKIDNIFIYDWKLTDRMPLDKYSYFFSHLSKWINEKNMVNDQSVKDFRKDRSELFDKIETMMGGVQEMSIEETINLEKDLDNIFSKQELYFRYQGTHKKLYWRDCNMLLIKWHKIIDSKKKEEETNKILNSSNKLETVKV